MQDIWIWMLVALLVGVLLIYLLVRSTGARKRYFLRGAADPNADQKPAPTDEEGNPHTVVEIDNFDPITPVHPEEIPREPQTPESEPAREDSPGWAHITDPPPTASDPSDGADPRRPPRGWDRK